MMMLFDKEYILKTYVENKEREATERVNSEIAKRMYKRGSSIEEISDILDTPLKMVEQWLGLVKA